MCHNRTNDVSAELVPAPRSILKEAINSVGTPVISVVLILCYAALKKEETSYSETWLIFIISTLTYTQKTLSAYSC
jgi:hypothetical protein